jgi:hypothetical protein
MTPVMRSELVLTIIQARLHSSTRSQNSGGILPEGATMRPFGLDLFDGPVNRRRCMGPGSISLPDANLGHSLETIRPGDIDLCSWVRRLYAHVKKVISTKTTMNRLLY